MKRSTLDAEADRRSRPRRPGRRASPTTAGRGSRRPPRPSSRPRRRAGSRGRRPQVEERERRDEDPEEERDAAEPRHGARWTRRASPGSSTTPRMPRERGRPPGVRSDDDARSASRKPQRTSGLSRKRRATSRRQRLLRAVQAVARVAEARDDVAVLVQARGRSRRDDDLDVGMLGVHALDPLGRGDEADQRDRARARVLDRRRSPPRSSCRSRASGRAGSRRARRGRLGSFT